MSDNMPLTDLNVNVTHQWYQYTKPVVHHIMKIFNSVQDTPAITSDGLMGLINRSDNKLDGQKPSKDNHLWEVIIIMQVFKLCCTHLL